MIVKSEEKKTIKHLAVKIFMVLVVQAFLFAYINPASSQEISKPSEKPKRVGDSSLQLHESARGLLKTIKRGENIDKRFQGMIDELNAVEAEGEEAEALFQEIEKKVPFSPKIVARHQNAVRKYHENRIRFREIAGELRRAHAQKESPLAVQQKTNELVQFLKTTNKKKLHLLEAENRLPWRAAQPGKILLLGDASTISQAGAASVSASPPTGNDLSATPDVQITPEIQELAKSLDNHPLKIFRYVYNNYDYTPYYGSIKGSLDTFWEKEGNDYDLSTLLIALLRASNIPARYVRVKTIVPIENVLKWLDFNDPKAVLDYLSSARIPSGYYTQGDKITHAMIEHVYVEAYVPYANYRGTVQDDRGKIWVPMDPSFKMYKVTQEGTDIASEMGFDWQLFTDNYLENYRNATPLEAYKNKVEYYLSKKYPGQTIDSIKRTTEISTLQFDLLPGTLPFKVTEVLGRFSEIPSNLRHSLRFTVGSALDYTASLPEISGRRLTLSFEAATAEDQAVIDQYGGYFETPPYLIEVKPILRINGAKVKEGTAMAAGWESPFTVEYHQTGTVVDIYRHNVMTGSVNALGITTGKVRPEFLTISEVEESEERYLPKMLHSLAMKYHNSENETKKVLNSTMKMKSKTFFAEVLVSTRETIKSAYGVPVTFELSGYMIDAKEMTAGVTPIDGFDKKKILNFMMVRGFESSAQEDRVFENNMFWLSGLSSVKGLQILKYMKVPITELVPPMTYTNPNLHEAVVEDINNALNMGWHVIVPEDTGGLGGIPYIKYDPNTGSGAYMLGVIDGGTSKYEYEINANLKDFVTHKVDPPSGTKLEKVEFEIYEPEQGKTFIWGEKFDAKIKMIITLSKDGQPPWTVVRYKELFGDPWKMTIQTGPYEYDKTKQPVPWNNPGHYNIMYDGKSIFNFYVWGPVLEYDTSDKYIGISHMTDEDTVDSPATIRYSIKQMEGITITSSKMQICDKNESVLREIENIPVGDNQEITWDGKKENGEFFPPEEYSIKIVSTGNRADGEVNIEKEVPTNPHKIIIFKVDIETVCEMNSPPYKCTDSFVASGKKEDIIFSRPTGIPLESRKLVAWECGDDTADNVDSGFCDVIPYGGPEYFAFNAAPPEDKDGRTGPLAYIVIARIRDDKGKSYESKARAHQDILDQLRQQYFDICKKEEPNVHMKYKPFRSEFVNAENYQNPEGHFPFDSVCSNGDIKDWVFFKIANQLEAVRSAIDNKPMPVNSGYRTPIWNYDPEVDGEFDSQHTYGYAADISSRIDYNGDGIVGNRADWDYLADVARSTFKDGLGACIEPYSPNRAGWVHMDWRPGACPW